MVGMRRSIAGYFPCGRTGRLWFDPLPDRSRARNESQQKRKGPAKRPGLRIHIVACFYAPTTTVRLPVASVSPFGSLDVAMIWAVPMARKVIPN